MSTLPRILGRLGPSLMVGALAAISATSLGHAQSIGPAAPSPAAPPTAPECPAALGSVAARDAVERFADEVASKPAIWTTDMLVTAVKRDLAAVVSQGKSSDAARADRNTVLNLGQQTLAVCFPRLGAMLATTDRAQADRLARRQAVQLQQQAERKAADRSFEDARADFFAHSVPVASPAAAPRSESNPWAAALEQLMTPPPDADQPGGRLVGAYRDYIFVRRCFDSRSSFAAVYVTPEELDAAKAQVKAIEDALLKQAPGLDKDERWATANRLNEEVQRNVIVRMDPGQQAVVRGDYTAEGRAICRSAVTGLRDDYEKIDPAAKNLRKDF